MSVEEQNVVEFSENPGRRLRVQRQSRGLEIERIAAQLHLRPAIIEAIEQDRYGDLPGAVFVVGYIRNYARLLGLDPEPLISAYRATNPTPEVSAPRIPSPPRAEIGSGHILVRLVSLALLAGVIAMLVLWWQDHGGSLAELVSPGTEPAAMALPQGQEDPVTDAPLAQEVASAEEFAASPAPSATTMTSVPAPAPAPSPDPVAGPELSLRLPAAPVSTDEGQGQSAPPPANEPAENEAPTETPLARTPEAEPIASQVAESGPPEVALSFSGPCWIDVRDSAGKVMLNGEMAKGDRQVLDGIPPYSFVIGNAAATTVTVGGDTFDLASRAKGNVARFKLNPGADE